MIFLAAYAIGIALLVFTSSSITLAYVLGITVGIAVAGWASKLSARHVVEARNDAERP